MSYDTDETRTLIPRCAASWPTTLLPLALLAGCGDDADPDQPPAPDAGPTFEDPGPIHVHGLGINPKDGALFVATHTGLFRAPKGDPTAKRVADRYQDTMGFAVVGPNRFLGSGHPDAREELPPFLGLIRSITRARIGGRSRSWVSPTSMFWRRPAPRATASSSPPPDAGAEFLVSADGGESWDKPSPPGGIVSLAVDPGEPERVVAAIEGGPPKRALRVEGRRARLAAVERRGRSAGWTSRIAVPRRRRRRSKRER